jgi:chromosome segregation protein
VYLKRIEITGFKSFATKTVLDLLPSCSLKENGKNCGITAIVGPNGSGKSNIADAIKWAMGEQSLKILRGKKSEDVIFAGSGKKSQLGSAKVSLFFDNSDKKIPLEFEEVVITRKVYRSGEGEYLINGSKVRLIDIADLLAKAGVGQRSYCIINQGMADAVLNATPVERRVILEEAAGVKPYQLKKERSLRKLDSTRQNLGRVGDLVKEIEPHLRVLKRQSDKARKGEEVARELKEKQNLLYGYLWMRVTQEKRRITEEKEEMGREEMKLQRKIDDLDIKIKQESRINVDFESRRNALEKEREDYFIQLNEARKTLAVVEAKIEIEKEKAKNFSIVEEIPVDLPYLKGEFKKIRLKYEQLEQKLSKAETLGEIEGIKAEFQHFRKEIDKFYRELSEEKKENISEKRENIVNLKIVGELEQDRKNISQKISILDDKLSENRKRMDNLFQEDRASRSRYFELEAEIRREQMVFSGIRDKMNEIRIRQAKTEVREEDLGSKIREEMGITSPDEINVSIKQGEIIDVDSLDREVGRLKVLSEQIGAIDPMIIDEYEETQKRYDFLTSQSTDLENAIVSLSKIIKEMDEKIKDSFEETLQKVNAEFSKYFRIIFGGGSAELSKTKIENRRNIKEADGSEIEDEDEVAEEEQESDRKEVGLEIKACPPGKKIHNLSMLSGGERALTSQALLFAIIANNPPPFAVLDEVEAALDEANSKRFGRILQELAHHTQFVLISHNRETMRQASFLYGITMGADGISKVLSVKLDQVGEKGEIK